MQVIEAQRSWTWRLTITSISNRSVRVSAVLRGVEGVTRGQCRGSDAEFRLELRSSGAVPSAPMSKVPVGRRLRGHVAQRDRLEGECSRPGETCWPGCANGAANGDPAKRARRGEPGAAGATLAQAAKLGKRVSVLIIRRSWVRAPPAPLTQSAGQGAVTCGYVVSSRSWLTGACAVVRGERPGYAGRCAEYVPKTKINWEQVARAAVLGQPWRRASLMRRLASSSWPTTHLA